MYLGRKEGFGHSTWPNVWVTSLLCVIWYMGMFYRPSWVNKTFSTHTICTMIKKSWFFKLINYLKKILVMSNHGKWNVQ
jgi:hypothetical protein